MPQDEIVKFPEPTKPATENSDVSLKTKVLPGHKGHLTDVGAGRGLASNGTVVDLNSLGKAASIRRK